MLMKQISLISILAAALLLGCRNSSADAASGSADVSETVVEAVSDENPQVRRFIDFEVVEDPSNPGKITRLSDYVGKGKYILVDFWASWCPPCREEIPGIRAVWKKYAGKDFDVVSVAVADRIEDSKAAISAFGMDWIQILNTGSIAADAYGIQGIPRIMLFGPDGTLVADELRGSDIEKAVRKALGR